MLNFEEDSKYVTETISIIVSFWDVLSHGDYIVGLPTITVGLMAGIDPTPSNILYQSVIVTNGNTVEQRFRLGIPGVIYTLTYEIETHLGQTIEKQTLLAILPVPGNVNPEHTYIYLTSNLYPLETSDQYQTTISIQNGLFWLNPRFFDGMQTYIAVQNGLLTPAQIFYTAPPVDFYQSFISIQDGTFTVGQIFYTAPGVDFYKTAIAILDGTFTLGQVFYTNPPEEYQTFISIQNGTLS